MARPKSPPELKPVAQNVRLTPDTADRVCRLALKRGISVYALLGGIIERVFEKQKTLAPAPACYGSQSSTLSGVLSESATLRSSRPAAPSTPR